MRSKEETEELSEEELTAVSGGMRKADLVEISAPVPAPTPPPK